MTAWQRWDRRDGKIYFWSKKFLSSELCVRQYYRSKFWWWIFQRLWAKRDVSSCWSACSALWHQKLGLIFRQIFIVNKPWTGIEPVTFPLPWECSTSWTITAMMSLLWKCFCFSRKFAFYKKIQGWVVPEFTVILFIFFLLYYIIKVKMDKITNPKDNK